MTNSNLPKLIKTADSVKRFVFTVLIFSLAGTSSCYANAGVPMLVILWPLFWLAFIPIVLIESYILRRYLQEIKWKQALKVCTYSNLFSTLIGIPITWMILVMIELPVSHELRFSQIHPFLKLIIESPWTSEKSVPLAGIILLVLFYFISVWSEHFVVREIIRQFHDRRQLKKAVYAGNLASYGFLLLIWLVYYTCVQTYPRGLFY